MDFDAQHLLRLLDESFGGTAWHGTNLRGSLRGLTAIEASWRPAPGRHNIWEMTKEIREYACHGGNLPRSGPETERA